jgi:hypothetical protein
MLVSTEHEFIFLRPRKVASTLTYYCLADYCRSPRDVVGIDSFEEYQSIRSRYDLPAMKNYVYPLTKWTPRLLASNTLIPLWEAKVLGKTGAATPSRPRLTVHPRASDVRRFVGPKTFDAYLKVSNVRNPFTRLVSHYEFTLMKYRKAGKPSPSFRQWFVENQSRLYDFYTENGEIRGRSVVDYWIRTERLAEDLDALRTLKGLDRRPSADLIEGPRVRASNEKPDYEALYGDCPEARRFIETRFSHVLEGFGYNFPRPQTGEVRVPTSP